MQHPSFFLPTGNAVYISGNGDPLLVLGGGPGLSSRVYRTYLVPNVQRCQTICWDYAATGDSQPRGEVSFEADYADLLVLIETVKLKKFKIFAHSYGSLLAMKLALEKPELIERMMILSGFTTFLPLALDLMERKARNWTSEEVDESFSILEHMQEGTIAPEQVMRLLELESKAAVARATPEEARKLARECGFDPFVYARNESWFEQDFSSTLRSIKVPTWIGIGKKDNIVPPEATEQLLAIPGSVKAEFPNSAHWALYEEQLAFARELSFLDRK